MISRAAASSAQQTPDEICSDDRVEPKHAVFEPKKLIRI
jgi:hypothetical protein